MPFLYPGLYNSSYVPEHLELKFAENPGGYLNPYILAVMLTFLVAGTIASQAATYWRSKLFRDDSLSLRLHVAVVLLVTTLKLLQVGAAGIMDFSVHYGDYLYLTHKDWLFRISVLLATIVSATVQVFFIKRVSTLSHHSFVFLTPTLLAWLGSIASAIWVTVVFPEDWAKRSHSFVIAGRVAPALTLFCDLLVTGFAMYYLLDKNLRVPDESQVFRIIRIMLESAAPPCVTAALNVVFDDQAAGGFVFLFVALTPMLQTFSMLYSLNSRKYFRERGTVIKSVIMSTDNRTPVSSRMNFATASHGTGGSTALNSPYSVSLPMPEPLRDTPKSAGYDKLSQIDLDHDLSGNAITDSPALNYTTASPPTSQKPLLLASPSSSTTGSPRSPPRPPRSPLRLQFDEQQRSRSIEAERRQQFASTPFAAGRGAGTPPRPQGPRS